MSLRRNSTVVWLTCFALAIIGATAARLTDAQVQQLQQPQQQVHSNALLTYYFDISKPQILPSMHGSGRPGRTPVTVAFSQPSISSFMPVVSPKASGMTHEVSKTWDVLKHLATMFDQVKALNARQPNHPRLFPRGSLAIQAAADNAATKTDITAVINAAESNGKHDIWAETSPGSLLLLPTGQSTTAVGDLMDVTYDSQTELITLHIDLVDNPDTISEFHPHGKQSLAADESHYHFHTAPGVKVDAAALLKDLQQADFKVDGMHVFLKGTSTSCLKFTFTPGGCPSPATVEGGAQVNVTIQIDASGCGTGQDWGSNPYIVIGKIGSTTFGSYNTRSSLSDSVAAPTTPGNNDGADRAFSQIVPYIDVYGKIATTWAVLQADAPAGPFAIEVSVIGATGGAPNPQGNVVATDRMAVFNCGSSTVGPTPSPCGPPVSKLLLSPAKAYRHVHDPITVTAIALGANNAPIANASVVLAVYGDCDPWISQSNDTTDAAGQATFTIRSVKPGALSVVAAMVDSQGLPVVSYPTHIIFFEEHSFIDEREQQYYGPDDGNHEHDGDGDGGYRADGGDDDDKGYSSDAESYAAAAKKAALQQIGGQAVIQRT